MKVLKLWIDGIYSVEYSKWRAVVSEKRADEPESHMQVLEESRAVEAKYALGPPNN